MFRAPSLRVPPGLASGVSLRQVLRRPDWRAGSAPELRWRLHPPLASVPVARPAGTERSGSSPSLRLLSDPAAGAEGEGVSVEALGLGPLADLGDLGTHREGAK